MHVLTLIALLFLTMLPLQGGLVTYSFTGVWGGNVGPVHTGDAFSGFVAWDTSTVGAFLPNWAPLMSYSMAMPAADGLNGPSTNIFFEGAHFTGSTFDFVQINQTSTADNNVHSIFIPTFSAPNAALFMNGSQTQSTHSSSYAVVSGTVLTSFQGGTVSSPVVLVGSAVGAVTGTIAGQGSPQDFYSFFWPGGAFSATASVTGASPTASYQFSEGLIGTCNGGASQTLNSGNSFTAAISIPSLAAGQYCLGLSASGLNDPTFALFFDTAVNGVPEPSGFVLLTVGLGAMGGALRLKTRSR